jgi:hypothetical protein
MVDVEVNLNAFVPSAEDGCGWGIGVQKVVLNLLKKRNVPVGNRVLLLHFTD